MLGSPGSLGHRCVCHPSWTMLVWVSGCTRPPVGMARCKSLHSCFSSCIFWEFYGWRLQTRAPSSCVGLGLYMTQHVMHFVRKLKRIFLSFLNLYKAQSKIRKPSILIQYLRQVHAYIYMYCSLTHPWCAGNLGALWKAGNQSQRNALWCIPWCSIKADAQETEIWRRQCGLRSSWPTFYLLLCKF